jgi:hypothetical protein
MKKISCFCLSILVSTLAQGEPALINPQVTSAITQSNTKVVGEAPAMSMGLSYQSLSNKSQLINNQSSSNVEVHICNQTVHLLPGTSQAVSCSGQDGLIEPKVLVPEGSCTLSTVLSLWTVECSSSNTPPKLWAQ